MHVLLRRFLPALLLGSAGMAGAGGTADIRVETELSESRPLVQQTVILKLRVYHPTTVRELIVEPVFTHDFTLERLDGQAEQSRMTGPQQMATDFVYALTPLTAGLLELPALPIRAVIAQPPANAGQGVTPAEEMVRLATEAMTLEVRAMDSDSAALLPLHGLEVRVQFEPGQPARVGQPLRVTIVQNALGVDGKRLPAAAELLASEDFRVYPGQSRTSSRLARNGRILEGRRKETLTLVPQRGGRLQIPPVNIAWWDVNRHAPADSAWPGRSLEVQPSPGSVSGKPAPAPVPDTSSGSRWPGLSALLPVMFAFGAGWWLRGRCTRAATGEPRSRQHFIPLRWFRHWLRRVRPASQDRDPGTGGQLWSPLTGLLSRLYSRRPIEALRRRSPRLPVSGRVRRGTAGLQQQVQGAADIRALMQALQTHGSESLGLPARHTLVALDGALETAYPRIDASRVRRLLQELDAALYGGAAGSLQIESWKRDFIEALERAGGRRGGERHTHRAAGLPVLNPG